MSLCASDRGICEFIATAEVTSSGPSMNTQLVRKATPHAQGSYAPLNIHLAITV